MNHLTSNKTTNRSKHVLFMHFCLLPVYDSTSKTLTIDY